MLRPCVDPAAVLATVLKTLATCNAAKRLDLDWQAQNEVHRALIVAEVHAGWGWLRSLHGWGMLRLCWIFAKLLWRRPRYEQQSCMKGRQLGCSILLTCKRVRYDRGRRLRGTHREGCKGPSAPDISTQR